MSKIKIFLLLITSISLFIFANTPDFLSSPVIEQSKYRNPEPRQNYNYPPSQPIPFSIFWDTLAPVPDNLYRSGGCCDTSGHCYKIGGQDGYNVVNNTVYKYFADEDSWCEKQPMLYALSNLGAVFHAPTNRIYVFGGYTGSSSVNHTQIYDIAQDSWFLGTPHYLNYLGSYGATIGDTIYITGSDLSALSIGIWGYNVNTNEWRFISSLPGGSAFGSAAVYENKIYFAGGWEHRDTVCEYTVGIGITDSLFCYLPYGSNGHCLEEVQGKLWFFGVTWSGPWYTVCSYDLDQGPNGSWSNENPLPYQVAGPYGKMFFGDSWRIHTFGFIHLRGTITSSPYTRDVAVTEINEPGSVVYDTMHPKNISATVRNYSEIAETIDMVFDITGPRGYTYSDTVHSVTLNIGQQLQVSFARAVFPYQRTYQAMCYISPSVPADTNLHNDTAYLTFRVVIGTPPCGWEPMCDIPASASGRNPKSGTCITGLDATDKIYLLKASNTSDFYAYNPAENTWYELEPIPKGLKETGDGRNPKHGAAIAAYEPNKSVYILRGNNTLGFWKYQADTVAGIDTIGWKKLANIPGKYKRCKYKAGLVAVTKHGIDYLFCMKGAKTNEFYLYDIAQDTWFEVKSPTTGFRGKTGYKKGSCLCYDGTEYVYVLQGYYGAFFKYHIESDSWIKLDRYYYRTYLNRDGRRKKPKGGAALLYYNNKVYMLKGGNTSEVWRYSVTTDTWTQMSESWDIPLGPTGKKKVKDGGSMIKFGHFFFATKGNNTLEFYRHFLPAYEAVELVKSIKNEEGIMGNRVKINSFNLSITPNPAKNATHVKYSLPVPGPVHIKLYDVSGKLVKSYNNPNPTQNGMFLIDCKKLPSGIYLLRFNSNKIKVTRKIVFSKNK
jgi:hypothetical protein